MLHSFCETLLYVCETREKKSNNAFQIYYKSVFDLMDSPEKVSGSLKHT